MNQQILLPDRVKREMNTTFKCGENELNRALTYARNSSRAKMLRIAALERGGVIYTGAHAPNGYCPEVETRHDHATGMMYQNIGKRVELQVQTRPGNVATIVVDGEPVATLTDLTLKSWGDALYSLQQIYNQLI
jgi:hypothetical protein